MLVEELLELLVDVVDTNLLETVVVEDLEASNIQDTDVLHLLHGGVNQGLVTLLHHQPEGSLIDGASNAGHGAGGQRAGGALLHPLGADLDLGLAEEGDHPLAVDTGQRSDPLGRGLVLDLGLTNLQ